MNATLRLLHLALPVLTLGLLPASRALPPTTTPTPPAPLGLLRLKSDAVAGQPAALTAAKYNVDDLSANGVVGASKSRKDNADYLALDAGKDWSRTLRGSSNAVTFVSFQIYASQNTIINIGPASLGVTAGPNPRALQLMFDDSAGGTLHWRTLNVQVSMGKHGTKNLAALPTLTVRLDPQAGVWDVFSGSRLLADNLPIIAARKDDRQFNVHAGVEGAWLSGLVMSDENPFYEDVNANGIDDAFERVKRGGALLPANATIVERQLLARQWKDSLRTKPAPPLQVLRPMADGAAVSPPAAP